MSRISIITPVFNASRYIQFTYDSILAQTHHDWEWILIDDQSTDDSLNILKSFASKDARIKLIQNSKNSGAAYSRNVGLDNTSGEYVAFIDADDQWSSQKLEIQLSFMQQNNSIISCHNYNIMSEDGSFVRKVLITPQRIPQSIFAFKNPIATSFTMLKREAIGELRFHEQLRTRQDWVFWYELLRKGESVHILNDVLGNYRKDSVNSISKNKFKMANVQWHVYRNYFNQDICEASISFLKYAIYGIKKHYL